MIRAKRWLAAAALLGLITLVGYAGALRNGFVWDDIPQVVQNRLLRSNQPISKILFGDVWAFTRSGGTSASNYYRPLQMLTFRLTMDSAALQPAAFHAVSLAFQFFAVLAAYLLFLQLLRLRTSAGPPHSSTDQFLSAGLAAAVLFAVHPVHTEAVLWISALAELGCALFYFLAFSLFLFAVEPDLWPSFFSRDSDDKPRARRASKRSAPAISAAAGTARQRWFLALSGLSFLVALLWKEMALSLPLVIAAFALLFPRPAPSQDNVEVAPSFYRRFISALRYAIPYLGVTVLYAVLRVWVLGYFAKAKSSAAFSGAQLVASTLQLAGQYCLHLAWPVPLTTWYVFHPASATDVRVIAAAIFLLAVLLAIFWLARRAPVAAFALAWILLTLLPVLNIRGIAGPTVFYERYLYIPSFGFCLLLPLAWDAVWHTIGMKAAGETSPPTLRYAGVAAAVVVAVISTVVVRARVPDWADDRALVTSALRYAPDVAELHVDLGNELRPAGDLHGAFAEYQVALRLALSADDRPRIATAYVGLAGIAWKRGQAQESLDFARRGLQYDSDLPALKTAEGLALLQMNRTDEAERALSFALSPSANDPVAVNTLGTIAAERGDFATAIRDFNRALEINPEFADGYFNLGLAEVKSGAIEQAIPHLQRATELQPRDPEYLTTYGAALLRDGRLAEAQSALQRALLIAPGYPEAVRNLNLLNQKLAGR